MSFVQNRSCNLTAVRVQNKTVGVRELLAFLPWFFSTGQVPLIPYSGGEQYMGMWKQLFDPEGFAGKWGLRTAEKRHVCHNYTWDKMALAHSKSSNRNVWNAPSWPFETSRVLTGMANAALPYADDHSSP